MTPADGFVSTEQLIAHYRAGSPRDLSAIDWYVVLACFKLAILLEGSYARTWAQEGADAAATRLNDPAGAALAAAVTLTGPGKASYQRCDVSQREPVQAAFDVAVAWLGGLAGRAGRLDQLRAFQAPSGARHSRRSDVLTGSARRVVLLRVLQRSLGLRLPP